MLSSYILIFIVVVVCIGKSIIFCCILPLIFLITLSIKDLNYSNIIFVIHGFSRNASSYLEYCQNLSIKLNALIIAPEFKKLK